MRDVVFGIIEVGLIVYFAAHMLAGDLGLFRWHEMRTEHHELSREIDVLTERRDSLRATVDRLRSGSVDLDYVDELARKRLKLVRPDEYVITIPAKPV